MHCSVAVLWCTRVRPDCFQLLWVVVLGKSISSGKEKWLLEHGRVQLLADNHSQKNWRFTPMKTVASLSKKLSLHSHKNWRFTPIKTVASLSKKLSLHSHKNWRLTPKNTGASLPKKLSPQSHKNWCFTPTKTVAPVP